MRVVVEHARQRRRRDDAPRSAPRSRAGPAGRRTAAGPSARRSRFSSRQARGGDGLGRARAPRSRPRAAARPASARRQASRIARLLVEGQRRRLAERAERARSPGSRARAIASSVPREDVEVDREVLAERSRDRRKDALPCSCATPPSHRARLAERRTGLTGGAYAYRESQPNRNSSAGPQTRPWQGPMPARVASLASRARRSGGEVAEARRPRSGRRSCPARGRGEAPRAERKARSHGAPRSAGSARAPPGAGALGGGAVEPAGRSEPRDLPLGDRGFDAGDAAGLAGAEHAGERRSPATRPDHDRAAANVAAEQARELGVRDEAVADGRKVAATVNASCARRVTTTASTRSRPVRLQDPGPGPVRRREEPRAIARRLGELARGTPEARARTSASDGGARLLRDQRDARAGLRQRRGHRQEQRAGARDHGPPAGERAARFRRAPAPRRLPSRPAGSIPGTGGRAPARRSRGRRAARGPRALPSRPRRTAGTLRSAATASNTAAPYRTPAPERRESRDPRPRRRQAARSPGDGGRSVRRAPAPRPEADVRAPDSAARHAAAIPAGPAPTTATSQSSLASTVRAAGASHVSRDPIPSTRSMQARRCGTPSIVTRHSKQTPIAQRTRAALPNRPAARALAGVEAAATCVLSTRGRPPTVSSPSQACARPGRRASASRAPGRSGSRRRGSRPRRAARSRAPS